MSDVTTSVDVHVPLRTAYNQWTQFESFPAFMRGVVAVRQLDDRHLHWVTEIAGTRREFDAEIVEQLPDERIAWRSTDGDVRHSGKVMFELLRNGETRVSVDLEWEPESLVEKAGGAIGIDRLQIKADLERFRRFIEGRGTETGEWRGQVPEPSADDAEGPARLAGTVPPSAVEAIEPGHRTPDVIDILTAQHEQVKDLMARTADAEGDTKQQLFAELVDLLKEHEKGEQRVLHPVTRTTVPGGGTTANARLGEEERADALIAEIKVMRPGSSEFDTWFDQLRHAVLDHAEHEEREEFPKLRQELSPERLRSMAEELVAVQTARN